MPIKTTRLLVIPAEDRESPDKITITISSRPCSDRARVLIVLAHLFSSDSEWDGPRPNVDLFSENVED